MICSGLASLAVATMIGALLMAAPAQARFGGGGVSGGGGFAVAHVGGFSGFRRGFVRGPAFVGRPFVPYRQFVPPFTPISAFYSYGPSYPSCWTWLPTDSGWRRVYVCHWPYGLGYDYY
jgi:hypothetical protein